MPPRRADSVFALFRNRSVADQVSRGVLRLRDLSEADFTRPGYGVLSVTDRQALQVRGSAGAPVRARAAA
jgi:hypothetical protein